MFLEEPSTDFTKCHTIAVEFVDVAVFVDSPDSGFSSRNSCESSRDRFPFCSNLNVFH